MDLFFAFVVMAAICLLPLFVLLSRFRHEFQITEGCAGLLFLEGRLVDTLSPGRHVRWGRHYRTDVIGTRKTLLQVAGQEVLTADSVTVKLSAVLTIQIVDAAKSALAADNYTTHLYNSAQAAMRTAVAAVPVEELLAQRVAIAAQLRELILPTAESVGVQLHAVEVRDVMLPGELRKAFSETLKARQEGQAALERARGETAALRHLANTARLLESHPSLTTLRFLQTLESGHSGQHIFMNDLSAMLPALRGKLRATGAPDEDDPADG